MLPEAPVTWTAVSPGGQGWLPTRKGVCTVPER